MQGALHRDAPTTDQLEHVRQVLRKRVVAASNVLADDTYSQWIDGLTDKGRLAVLETGLSLRDLVVTVNASDEQKKEIKKRYCTCLLLILPVFSSVESCRMAAEMMKEKLGVGYSRLKLTTNQVLFTAPVGSPLGFPCFSPQERRMARVRMAITLFETLPLKWMPPITSLIESDLSNTIVWLSWPSLSSLFSNHTQVVWIRDRLRASASDTSTKIDKLVGDNLVRMVCSLCLNPGFASELISEGIVTEVVRNLSKNDAELSPIELDSTLKCLCLLGRLEVPEFDRQVQESLLDVVLDILDRPTDSISMATSWLRRCLVSTCWLNTSIRAQILKLELQKHFPLLPTSSGPDQGHCVLPGHSVVRLLRRGKSKSSTLEEVVTRIVFAGAATGKKIVQRRNSILSGLLEVLRRDVDCFSSNCVFLPDSILEPLAKVESPSDGASILHVLVRKDAGVLWLGTLNRFISDYNPRDSSGATPFFIGKCQAKSCKVWEMLVFDDRVRHRPESEQEIDAFHYSLFLWRMQAQGRPPHALTGINDRWLNCASVVFTRLAQRGSFRKVNGFLTVASLSSYTTGPFDWSIPRSERQRKALRFQREGARLMWISEVALPTKTVDLNQLYLPSGVTGRLDGFIRIIIRAGFLVAIRSARFCALKYKNGKKSPAASNVPHLALMLGPDILSLLFGVYLKWFELKTSQTEAPFVGRETCLLVGFKYGPFE